MARGRHSIEQKLSALHMMEEEKYTWKEITEAHHVSKDALRVWKAKFDIGGIDALKESKTWNPYTKEQKIAAVRDYLDGATTIEVLSNHQISDGSVLRKWIKKYTSHRELTDSRKGMASYGKREKDHIRGTHGNRQVLPGQRTELSTDGRDIRGVVPAGLWLDEKI